MLQNAVNPPEEIESSTDAKDVSNAPAVVAKLAIVIPTLREAENIRIVLNRIREALDPLGFPYELLVVDDNSRDGIDTIVQEVAKADSRVRLLIREHERGLGGAVLHGWRNTEAEVFGVIDADL